ncbi:MAG: hypothetical protein R3324_14230 [Halobacteriales archaeon]|nr:hypothetical protein [Halobacteriales archaeon]
MDLNLVGLPAALVQVLRITGHVGVALDLPAEVGDAFREPQLELDAAQGPNNWGFIPYTDFGTGMTTNPSKWTSAKKLVDEELRQKIREVRQRAHQDRIASDQAPAQAPTQPAAPADAPDPKPTPPAE